MPRESESQAVLPAHEIPPPEQTEGSGDADTRQRAAAAAIARDEPTPRERWEQTLGRLLGGQLYEVLVRELSADDILRMGRDAVDRAARSFGSTIAKESPTGNAVLDRLRAQAFGAELQRAVAPLAQQYLLTGPGKALATSLSSFLQGEPVPTLALIILAAAAAYAADMPLPELSGKLNLGGGFGVGVTAELGSFRNLALEAIGASLTWQGRQISATVRVQQLDGERALSATSGFRPRLVAGQFDDDAVVQRLSADVTYRLTGLPGSTISLRNETFLQHGKTLSGTIGARLDAQLDPATQVGVGLSQGYGPGASGTGVTFRMQVHERFTFEGTYDSKNGTYVGVLLRIPL